MEDDQIVELFWKRSEQAIREAEKKHGRTCLHMAKNILGSYEDACECVNDALLRAWESIPPERPQSFFAFLARITRNLSLDRLRRRMAQKRGGGAWEAAYDELAECISEEGFEDRVVKEMALSATMNRFLADLSVESRILFMQRYFYFCSIREIAKDQGMSESKVKMSLMRSREKLKKQLREEDMYE